MPDCNLPSHITAQADGQGELQPDGYQTARDEGLEPGAPCALQLAATSPVLAHDPRPAITSLTIPSAEDLQATLARSTTIEQLADFDRMMSVLEEAGQRFKFLIDEAIRIATFQLSGKRKLGLALLQHPVHGGDRARSQRAKLTADSPQVAIDKDRRRRYKALARIPDDLFAGYLRTKSEQKEIPNEAGALRSLVVSKRPRQPPLRAKPSDATGPPSLPHNMAEACVRCLGDIHILLGEANVAARLQLDSVASLAQQASGSVLAMGGANPDGVVRVVETLVLAGRITVALVVLPREIDRAGLAAIGEGSWSFCIPRDPRSPIMAHIGSHAHAFWVVFSQFGPVLVARCRPAGQHSKPHD